MLTSDLMRVGLRKGVIKPSYIKETHAKLLELAADLIELHADHVEHTRGELDEALHNFVGAMPNFRLVRGLAKLLDRRTECETDSAMDPSELRTLVFERAAAAHPISREGTRDALLDRLAEELEITRADIERGLFADLRSEQRVISFDPITPAELLARYNVSLAQGVLLRADSMTVNIKLRGRLSSARYRQLFRYIKFHQLLHTIEPRKGGGYTVTIDGPMSLFRHSGKYGFQMACFLPALLLCKGWTLEARVLWGKARKPYTFSLSADDGLTSHYRDRGVYLTEEEALFVDRFEARDSPWKLERGDILLKLGGQGLLVPDFRFKHAEDGREAYLEIIGFWRADYLSRRVALLAKKGPKNLILAVSDKLQTDKLDLSDLPIEVFFFKRVIRPKAMADVIERVALAPRSRRAKR